MMRSESIKEITAALVKAQKLLKHAVFDSKNTHFKSEYASLAANIDAGRDPLADNNLAVTQTVKISETGAVLVTTLMHISGEWISGEMPLLVPKSDMPGLGSAITYARRYAFAAIICISQDSDDDDGNKSAAADKNQKNQQSFMAQLNGQTHAPPPLEQMLKAFAKFGVSKIDIQTYFAVKDLSELSGAELNQLRDIGIKMKNGQIQKQDVFK